MIKYENGRFEANGTAERILQDFLNISCGFKNLLVHQLDAGPEDAKEIILELCRKGIDAETDNCCMQTTIMPTNILAELLGGSEDGKS